jgi:hypothetical protein
MIRLLRTLILPAIALALLASPAFAQGSGDRQTIHDFYDPRLQAISELMHSDIDAAEGQLNRLKREHVRVEATNSNRALLDEYDEKIDTLQKYIGRTKRELSDLDRRMLGMARMLMDAPSPQGVMWFTKEAEQNIARTMRLNLRDGEAALATADAALSNVTENAPNLRSQVDRAQRQLQGPFMGPRRRKNQAALVGKQAMPLEVEAWLNGSPLTDADLRGKVVLIDFWSVAHPEFATFPYLN